MRSGDTLLMGIIGSGCLIGDFQAFDFAGFADANEITCGFMSHPVEFFRIERYKGAVRDKQPQSLGLPFGFGRADFQRCAGNITFHSDALALIFLREGNHQIRIMAGERFHRFFFEPRPVAATDPFREIAAFVPFLLLIADFLHRPIVDFIPVIRINFLIEHSGFILPADRGKRICNCFFESVL